MMAGPAHVIVLDLDDTLYLERDFVRSGFAAVSARLSAEGLTDGFGDAAWALFEDGRRGDIFNAALASLGLAVDEGLIDRIVTLYREHEPRIALQPDAARFIGQPPARCALAILTDGHLTTQLNKVRALGLDKAGIAPIVCTGLWGRDYWKPHERGFRHIAGHFDLPAGAFTYVADNPAKDFIAPRALGWRTVQIIRPGAIHPTANPHPADLCIESLDALTRNWIAGSGASPAHVHAR